VPRPGSTILWIGALGAAVLAVYAPVLRGLVGDWIHDPNYSHGFLIPAVSGFLIWQRRRDLAAIPASPNLLGLAGAVLALALLVLGAAGAEVFTQRVSLVLLMGSLVLFLFGRGWLGRLAFPLAFLLFAIPMPYVLYYSLTGPMQGFAAKAAVIGLKGVGVPVVAQGNIIHLPDTSLEVAEACSGIRSLYAFLALGALLAQSLPVPVWGRVIVFLVTIPVSVAANAFRVWGSGLGAYLVGPQVTQGFVHEFFGFVVFAAALSIYLLLRKGARGLWHSAH
jgi:exosortase